MIIDCEILAKARALAIKRKINPELVNCPFVELRDNCDGKICIYREGSRSHGTAYIEEDPYTEERKEELYDRLETCDPDDAVQLHRLREELRKLNVAKS